MRLLLVCCIMAAAVAPQCLANVDLTCDCRLWHQRDTSIQLHCKRPESSQVSCQKASVPDLPRGYQYIPGYGLLKLYRTFKTWWAAKEACSADGARLAVPPDQHAVDGMNQLFAKSKGLWWAWVGISDEASEGVFVGIDGRPAPFLPWQPKQPSDHEGRENCVNTRKDGLFNDLNCDWQSPFFCERPLRAAVPASYRWLGEAGRFYRLHESRLAHAAAAAVCRSENATLAVPDTWSRGEALLSDLVEPNANDYYHIGFTDTAVEGDFVTESGRHLNDMEFRVWAYRQPSNSHGGREEDCLALGGEGYYDDVPCDRELPFICEIAPA